MKLRRQITGVLCSFLDGYSSRYSDYDGYWIFGLLMRDFDRVSFDLLRDTPAASSAIVAEAARIARDRFASAITNSAVPVAVVADAALTLTKLEPPTVGPVNGRMCVGHRVSFVATAHSDFGKRYTAEKIVFVAPHDPSIELRSTRRAG